VDFVVNQFAKGIKCCI